MKRFLEKAVKWILTGSGFVTSAVILLIIGFLFTEGAGLFGEPVVEEGYVLALNDDNPVRTMTAAEIKAVFDEDITNWKELGGPDMQIMTFRLEDADEYFSEEELGSRYEHAGAAIASLVKSHPGMVAFVPESLIPENPGLNFIEDKNISPGEVLGGKEWFPTATPAPLFGILPLLAGTLWVSLFAILFALPFGISIAVYMSEVASERVRGFLKPVIELLNGIPSVVYGFFGLIVIVPMLQQVFGLPVGESGLAGSIVCPRTLREASLALGATKWQTIYKVVVPSSMSGIASGVVLGIGRAVGETMAVLMVTGNAAVIPASILEPLRTIPATIAAELGEAPAGGAHYQSLFLLGVILFFITFFINLCVEFISSRNRAKNR